MSVPVTWRPILKALQSVLDFISGVDSEEGTTNAMSTKELTPYSVLMTVRENDNDVSTPEPEHVEVQVMAYHPTHARQEAIKLVKTVYPSLADKSGGQQVHYIMELDENGDYLCTNTARLQAACDFLVSKVNVILATGAMNAFHKKGSGADETIPVVTVETNSGKKKDKKKKKKDTAPTTVSYTSYPLDFDITEELLRSMSESGVADEYKDNTKVAKEVSK